MWCTCEQVPPVATNDPKARYATVSYPGGTASAPVGTLEAMFGTLDFQWQASTDGLTPTGKRKRKYGTRQRTSARAGKPMSVRFQDGSVFTVRVTGADLDFIDYVLSQAGGRVIQAWTPRGTVYGPQYQAA